jgi:HEAT repeat protein
MRKFLLTITAIIALAAIIYISVCRERRPAASRISPESAKVTGQDESGQPAKTPKPETPLPEKSAEKAIPQDDPQTLIGSLKDSIAEGDWEKSKEICEKLATLSEAFDLLAKILLENSGMEESAIALRWRAAHILGLMEQEKAIGIFEQSLITEKASEVRSNIVLALGILKHPGARPLLESVLLNSEEETDIRRSAAAYLARISDGSGATFLRNLLHSDSAKDIKIWAIDALPEGVDKNLSSAVLADLLASSEDPEMKQAAAEALGRIAMPDTIAVLTSSLREDSDPRIRNTCAEALGNFPSNGGDVIPALVIALQTDKDPTVRGSAAQALGSLHKRDAVKDLKDALQREPDRVVRVRIVEALGKIGGEESKDILKNAAEKDQSVHVRKAAEEALKNMEK